MKDRDLSAWLREWPLEPGSVQARVIHTPDGREVLQMRVDLGVLQMEREGRPDGTRPENHESWADFYTETLAADDSDEAGLTSDDLRRLRDEAVQYSHRSIALFSLDEFDEVVRDEEHILRILDLAAAHGGGDDEALALERLRPNTVIMIARAGAAKAITRGDSRAALTAINAGLDELRRVFRVYGVTDDEFDDLSEARLLLVMRDALTPKLPASQRHELNERLRAAIAADNFELAAILRDELRQLNE
ncbi:MAG: UvrB/UvrC motif-containing protein [Phycisphaerales bacterium]